LYKDYTHKTINRSDCQTTPGIVHFAGREKPWNTKNPSYRHLIDWLDAYKKIFSCEPQFEDKLSRIKSLIKRYKDKEFVSIGKKGREIVSIYRRDARYRIEIFGKCVYSKRVEVEIF
jgi:lipopolysaccharide biosynthesis glycosyltransferase